MMAIRDKPQTKDGKTLIPLVNHGVKCMSIGFMVAEDTPTIWRGPMVMSALEQMLRDVEWGELDILVVDMPPGTGDAQLTMAQRVRSEEHTSELQSLMRISYAVFCLKKKREKKT